MLENVILLAKLFGEPDSLVFGYDEFSPFIIGDKKYNGQIVFSYDFNGNNIPDAYGFFDIIYKNGFDVKDYANRLILDPDEDLNGEIEFLDTDSDGVLDKKNVFH